MSIFITALTKVFIKYWFLRQRNILEIDTKTPYLILTTCWH